MELIEYGRKQKELGNVTALERVWEGIANELGVHSSLIRSWAYKTAPVSPRFVIKLERATQGEVLRQHSRPDLYPPEDYL